MIGKAASEIEQLGLARGAMVGDGGFDEMPGAIEFVGVFDVGPALTGFGDSEVRVEVAIGLLGGGEGGDGLIEQGLQIRVGGVGNFEREGFEPFVGIGVLKDPTLKFALGLPGGNTKVVEGSGFFQHLVAVLEGNLAIKLLLLLPEAAGEGDGGEGEWVEGGVAVACR